MLVVTCLGSEARRFAADLIVFDKDGTLIDFDALWAGKVHAGVGALVEATCMHWGCPPRGERGSYLKSTLYRILGYDEGSRSFAAEGPIVTATTETMATLAAGVVYQLGLRGSGGMAWLACEQLVHQSMVPAMDACFEPQLLRPLTGAVECVRALHQVGVAVAVVTSDDEAPTRQTLQYLGLAEAVGFVAGGQSGYGHKPAPDAFLAACRHAGAAPERTVVIGDTVTDMVMAQNGGAGLRVAVATGFAGPDTLQPYADCVISSLDELRIEDGA